MLQNSGLNSTLIDVLNTVALPILNGVQIGTIDGTSASIYNELKKNISTFGLEKLGVVAGLDAFTAAAIAAPITNKLFEPVATTTWTGQVPASTTESATISSEVVIDGGRGAKISLPATGTTQRAFWDNALLFLKKNLPLMSAVGTSAYYISQTMLADAGSIIAPASTNETPIPPGAVKAGYQIGSGVSYTVYDRLSGLAVKRVSNGVVEEGIFESMMVLNADGSISVDFRKPTYLSKGKLQYTTEQNGRVTFVIVDKKVYEIKIDAPAPDIILSPGATKDATNKILNGIVEIAKIGLKLTVTNGSVTKSSGGQQGSEELETRVKTAFIFGNGFENEYRAENTPDPLMQSYADTLRTVDKITNTAREFIVYLYEATKILGNAVDWYTDFKLTEDQKNFMAMLIRGGNVLTDLMLRTDALTYVPAPFKDQFKFWSEWYKSNILGLGNNLVQETISELEALQWGNALVPGKGPISDGIAFAHSGFTAPLLSAIEQQQYDVKTVLIYEGPHPNYKQNFTNPSLERIIHVQGTGGPFDGDAWVPFLGKAEFGGVENINITIEGAFHSDFSYNEDEWVAKLAASSGSFEELDRLLKGEERNRRVNIFMRRLYEAIANDQSIPGSLRSFLENTPGVDYNDATKFADVDLDYLVLVGI